MRRSAASSKPLRIRVTGHFGELIQGRVGGDIALVTLPCPAMWVEARWSPAPGRLTVSQRVPYLPRAWLRPLFRKTTGRTPFGHLTLRGTARPGEGCGASTASLLAITGALSHPDPVLALSLEGASDPLADRAPGTCLWASREGRVMGRTRTPAFDIIGAHFGPPQRTRAEDRNFAQIDDLAQTFLSAPDAATLAQLATTSAERAGSQRGLAGLTPLLSLVARTGALGAAIAHTGSARALLFAPGTADTPRTKALLREAGFARPIAWRTKAAP